MPTSPTAANVATRSQLIPENKTNVAASQDIVSLVEKQRKVQQEIKENEKIQQRLNRIPEELRQAINQSDIIDCKTKSKLKNRFQKNDQKIASDVAKRSVIAEIKNVKSQIDLIVQRLTSTPSVSTSGGTTVNQLMPKRRDEDGTKQLLQEKDILINYLRELQDKMRYFFRNGQFESEVLYPTPSNRLQAASAMEIQSSLASSVQQGAGDHKRAHFVGSNRSNAVYSSHDALSSQIMVYQASQS